MLEKNWNEQAKGILKAHLARKSIKYHDLARKLNAMGIEENQNTIATKISRGAFSFAFFLQCMAALGINKIDLNIGE
ncbi:DUF6471 domain-containing protein [Arcobacter sp. YIC-464]|uniref:DUF6471 domain-containing protein n=1 Tax=Arcobacter sp. YIC-464 TaxID=3376631 RepID=UPI003C258886